ncbi:MAG: RNA methyltransferase [Lachnospiraceae bacterium]|nr:RNA methyltransferase [Lachnospiraceae bacterium]
MITSSANAQVKEVIQLSKKAKERHRQQLFIVEGHKMFLEAPKSRIRKIFVTEAYEKEHPKELSDLRYEVVEERVFAQMSDTQTPQGVLCLIQMQEYSMEELLGGSCPLLLVLEDLQDPGNVGTILRTAEGAGVSGILLSRNCVDLFNPKTIRSTMGSIYRMPFRYVDSLKESLSMLRERNIHTYAAHLEGAHAYDQEDYRTGSAFLIGNEGNGLSQEISALADTWIRIPMCGQVESLNAAIAASLLGYEAFRQRRDNK